MQFSEFFHHYKAKATPDLQIHLKNENSEKSIWGEESVVYVQLTLLRKYKILQFSLTQTVIYISRSGIALAS